MSGAAEMPGPEAYAPRPPPGFQFWAALAGSRIQPSGAWQRDRRVALLFCADYRIRERRANDPDRQLVYRLLRQNAQRRLLAARIGRELRAVLRAEGTHRCPAYRAVARRLLAIRDETAVTEDAIATLRTRLGYPHPAPASRFA